MTFLHPALLWLLPLAAVPLLLHLLTLHRLRTVELSTFRFLFDSYVQQRRSMKFLEALLAALRTLFVLLLVLAVCRPVVKHWSELFRAGSGREVVLLVDCSASMGAATAGRSALDRAKAAALSVVERLSPEDRVTLVRLASRPEEVFTRFSSDGEAIRSRIEDLKVGASRGNVFAALTQLFAPGSGRRDEATIYLFTDCQKTGWKEVEKQGLDQAVPASVELVVVYVGSSEPVPNLAVAGDPPAGGRAVVGLPVFLRPRVVNHTKADADVAVNVLIDEKEVGRAELKNLKPGREAAAQEIIYYPREPGAHRGRFELAGPSLKDLDAFADDNNFYFTLTVVPRPRVLVVNGNPPARGFKSETLYLQSALAYGEASAGDTPANADALHTLEAREISETGLTPDSLRDASVVVLADCAALNEQQFIWLHEYVAAGGGLLVFPGDNVARNPAPYALLFTPPGSQAEPAVPVTLGAPVGQPDRPETFDMVKELDLGHPALTAFDDADAHFFGGVHFKKRFVLDLPEKRDRAWSLASFGSGSPALVESRLGDGAVIVAAFPANSQWTDLPKQNEFVPLVLGLVRYAQRRPEADGPAAVVADGAAQIAAAESWAPATGRVTDPAGRSYPLAFEPAGPRLLGAFDKTGRVGYYTVDVRGEGRAGARGGTVAFAVNLDSDESNFATLGENQLHQLLPGRRMTWIDASAEAQQLHGPVGNQQEVWRPLIWVLFAVIFAEFMLATLGGRRREDEGVGFWDRLRRLSPGAWFERTTDAPAEEPSK